MTDLELINKYCEECRHFINPKLFREIEDKGLYSIVNRLPQDVNEAKAIAHARLAKSGKFYYDEEIDGIASIIREMQRNRDSLNLIRITDADQMIPFLTNLLAYAQQVRDYYK